MELARTSEQESARGARGHLAGRADVTGLDFSPAMVALARANVLGLRFLEGGDLPFDDAIFDGVTMGFGMHHVPYTERVMAEARRVLKPDDKLLRGQPAENAKAIRDAVAGKVLDTLGKTGPWTIPIPSVVISARAG